MSPVEPAGTTAPHGTVERLTGLVAALRDHGFGIGTGETVDAGHALEAVGFTDRERVREALAATLLHGERQRPVFDRVFDLYFPLGGGNDADSGRPALDGTAADLAELRERLAAALAADDGAALAQLAAEAVGGFGGYGSGPDTDGWSSYQTLSRLRPETLLARVREARRSEEPEFADRLLDEEIRRRIEAFRERVRTEARRRVAERQGRDRVARRAVAGTADGVDFLLAGRAQLDELRRTVRPLARKLATRLAARRRRAARGEIDLRRTLRRSLSTGGVPVRPVLRRRRPGRPELVLLCDVSGSVAGFAQFTMLLVQALHDQFSRVRVFAFVNRVDEVTGLIARGAEDPAGLGDRILAEAELTGWHGQSDYGTALGEFADRYAEAVGPRTVLFVLGDARTNRADPNLAALKRVADRARRVHWLNPEQPSLWGTGDSEAPAYAEIVDMRPCRNARQLGALIGRLLPV
ncbi:VWA domain-containing protein [Streptomyces gardneri]|uniref:VWA domain-containing protein n=1 Tax=Streptomyces gardneri TaxID=66892 RepID=UPI0006BC4A57|nr:VWA domain-containing protein [Streptomyces gardneri]WRK41387.1 VWA domain-containing protein [Streptomyces venezuelae]CUM36168.1 carbon monoxide dehydrogenase E protein [Streptomyces venezuelae]